jgi:hypothetical protein
MMNIGYKNQGHGEQQGDLVVVAKLVEDHSIELRLQ